MAGGGETTSTVTQSNLPEYARPYYEALMDRGLGQSEKPYQPYQGQRLAGMSDTTAQGLDMSQQFAQSGMGNVNAASGLAGQAGLGALSMFGSSPTLQANNVGFDDVGRVGAGNFDANALSTYQSPYMQAVVDKAKQDAAQNFMNERQFRDTEAVNSGAFGGSRAAVREQMATNNLQKNLTDIDVQGAQAGFENAQQQFERDRAAQLTSQQANQQTGLNMALANQSKGLEAQGLSEQFRQSANQLGIEGMSSAISGLLNSQQAGDQGFLSRMQAQLAAGQAGEDYTQQGLDQSYNDFVNQRDAENQNLQFLSSLLRGVPISANQDVTQTQGTNPLAGILGSATGLDALYSLAQKK